ncbi:MAG: adenosylcobinamide-GDP ribazoletransferase [Kurthia sp.]|nr:adenosylcobinamide-GDP ribazoletransferase [Candidatus Kurthia equi]
MKGFLLALQFFTVIPIHKELPMTKKQITMMFSSLPIVGAMMGAVAALIYYSLQAYTDSTSLLTAFLLLMVFIILTGGLHLDGFVDMSDAYFSYRSIEKRHEILEDPRVGAFGAMGLVFLILAKFIFINELITKDLMDNCWLIFIPFLSRLGMSLYLIQTPTSKEKGLGAFFKSHLHLRVFTWTVFGLLFGGTALIGWWSDHWLMTLLLVGITLVATYVYRYWTIKNFKGSSGDLYGAFIEGMELVLWISLLLFL